MKKTKEALSKCIRKKFGNIFKQLLIKDEIVRIKVDLFEERPTAANRIVLQRAHAKLKQYLHYEKEFGGKNLVTTKLRIVRVPIIFYLKKRTSYHPFDYNAEDFVITINDHIM